MVRAAAGKTVPMTAKPSIYDVLPHEGDASKQWDLHKQGARKHEYFRTQKEAIEAARGLAAGRPAHVVLHARDGHVYREFDLA
jgi:uncharacterized protein YdaT